MSTETAGRPPQPILGYATDPRRADPDELAPITPGIWVVRGLLLLSVTAVVVAMVWAIAIILWHVG